MFKERKNSEANSSWKSHPNCIEKSARKIHTKCGIRARREQSQWQKMSREIEWSTTACLGIECRHLPEYFNYIVKTWASGVLNLKSTGTKLPSSEIDLVERVCNR